MKKFISRFVRQEEGLETVEYAVVAALITVAAVVAIGTVGTAVTGKFEELNTVITTGSPTP